MKSQVAEQFVKQYYPKLENHGVEAHEFYNDQSSMQFVDEGGLNISASSTQKIHNVIMSLQISDTEIKKISSFESFNGGVFMVVMGSFKPKNYNKRRKFVQSFLLATLQCQQTGPQVQDYFILHDVLHLLSDNVVEAPSQFDAVSEPLTPVAEDGSNKTFEYDSDHSTKGIIDVDSLTRIVVPKEATNKGLVSNSVVLDDASTSPSSFTRTSEDSGSNQAFGIIDPLSTIVFAKANYSDAFGFYDVSKIVSEPSLVVAQDEVQPQATTTPTPQDDKPDNVGSDSNNESPEVASEGETVNGETSKLSYASIVKTARGQLKQPATNVAQSVNIPQQFAQLPNRDYQTNGNINYLLGHSRSIYVRNLPSEVNTLEVIHEFRKFGKVKIDRIHIMKNENSGVCNAFVEFEDCQGAQNAIKASPIKFATSGRKIYVEARRSKSYNGGTSRGRAA